MISKLYCLHKIAIESVTNSELDNHSTMSLIYKLKNKRIKKQPSFTPLLTGISLVREPEIIFVHVFEYNSHIRNNSFLLIFVFASFSHRQSLIYRVKNCGQINEHHVGVHSAGLFIPD